MKLHTLTTSLLLVMSACSGAGEATLPAKDEVGAKADGDHRELCEEASLPRECDLCQEMGWYGDGACDNFCANPDPDCGPAIPTAITKHLSGGALPPIHPQLGVWTIYKPGLFPALSWHDTARELKADPPIMFALEPITCEVKVGPSTFDSCSEDVDQPTACMLTEAGPFSPISDVHKLMVEYDLGTPSADDKAAAKQTEQAIDQLVVVESALAKFYYGMVDGKLYLLVVDVASLDCSA